MNEMYDYHWNEIKPYLLGMISTSYNLVRSFFLTVLTLHFLLFLPCTLCFLPHGMTCSHKMNFVFILLNLTIIIFIALKVFPFSQSHPSPESSLTSSWLLPSLFYLNQCKGFYYVWYYKAIVWSWLCLFSLVQLFEGRECIIYIIVIAILIMPNIEL